MAAADVEERPQPLFKSIRGEVEELEATEIESLCVACEENGITRLLLTKIPFYKEVIVSSFHCEHCGHTNNEVQSASAVQEKGVDITLRVSTKEDLDRQVIKTDSSRVSIPELDFEIPAGSQKGVLTTIEGILDRAIQGLEQDQVVRRALDPALANQIDDFVCKLKSLKSVKSSFTLHIRDPSGNSFVENPMAPKDDPALTVTKFSRTLEELKMLGLVADDATEIPREAKPSDEVQKDEVLSFPTNCDQCQSPAETRMKMTSIPHFKEVVIMATTCDVCGARTNEVKVGGGISDQGRRITLRVTDPSDLTRDLLKSETCTLKIPELEFEAQLVTNGGKFTTVEGLLEAVKEQLLTGNPFLMGDSATEEVKSKMAKFSVRLDDLLTGQTPFTMVLEDPAGNSFIQNFYAPDPDPEMVIEDYDRTAEDDAFLGIDKMNTENYS